MTNDFRPGYYKCRDGSKAEVFAERGGRLFGIHENEAKIWAINGWLDEHGTPSVIDLISPWPTEPEKVELMINIYKTGMCVDDGESTDNYYASEIIDCRHITYTKGVRKSEDECVSLALANWTNFRDMVNVYLAAYRIGRVWDSTESHE